MDEPDWALFVPKNPYTGDNCSVLIVNWHGCCLVYLISGPKKIGGGVLSHFQYLLGLEEEREFPFWYDGVRIEQGKEKDQIILSRKWKNFSFEEAISFLDKQTAFKRA